MATETTSLTDTSSTEALVSSSSNNNSLHKHLTLFDLVCVGVGATVGSGVYAVCGLIAHSQAGPATFISWSIAGVAASVSGLCYAELGGRYPTSGSSYVYVKETFENELASVVAGACLTLEYVGSASAVARSWGDKVVEYLKAYQGEGSGWKILLFLLEPGFGINPCAFAVSAAAVLILLNGVKESKCVTNLFTVLNITLLLFVTGAALVLAKAENLTPLIVPEFGTAWILRGATSSFFGYIGFDEICCIAGESKNPVRDLPRAIILTLIIVTTLYIAASIGLAGMVPYADVSETSGFPNGFRYRGYEWAAEVAALGELIALPFVVLITIMAQPRLQYAMSVDGILPPVFVEVDSSGNLVQGLKISGLLMTVIATLVPFRHLDDLISSGILIAFTMTDMSVIMVRRTSPRNNPHLLPRLVATFIVSSFLSGFLLRIRLSNEVSDSGVSLATILACSATLFIGSRIQTKCPNKGCNEQGLFLAPFVPILPLCGIFINIYLVAQLELTGCLMIFGYLGFAVGAYLYRKNRRREIERMVSMHETRS
ncbi:amino acid transporter [Thalassiosira pseudonana CCMP1335]